MGLAPLLRARTGRRTAVKRALIAGDPVGHVNGGLEDERLGAKVTGRTHEGADRF